MSDKQPTHPPATGGYAAHARGREGDYGYSPNGGEDKGYRAPPPSAQLPPVRDPGPADAPTSEGSSGGGGSPGSE